MHRLVGLRNGFFSIQNSIIAHKSQCGKRQILSLEGRRRISFFLLFRDRRDKLGLFSLFRVMVKDDLDTEGSQNLLLRDRT